MDHLLSHIFTLGKLILLAKATSGIIGAFLCYRRDPAVAGERSAVGFFHYCFPRDLWTNPNVRMDAFFFVLNWFATAWVIVPLVVILSAIIPATANGLTVVFGSAAPHAPTLLLQFGLVVGCVIARDFGEFTSHMLCHRWQLLWEFHQVHHSSEFLSPFGEKRSHIVEDLFRSALGATLVGLFTGVYSFCIGLNAHEAMQFGIPPAMIAFTILHLLNFDVLHHSHIPFAYYSQIERFLISPAQHQVHHDRQGPSRNFGTFLAIWDRMYGSFSHSKPRSSYEIGLPPEDQIYFRTIPEMYVRPLIAAKAILWRACKEAAKRWLHFGSAGAKRNMTMDAGD
jgi:sterol desaturase/sphingolipid hydroxylase (fatty acid hydroxylase superfamily)